MSATAESSTSNAPPKLPYRLEALKWDDAHVFNEQNRYGYAGHKWTHFTKPMLMCEVCDQWFHASSTTVIMDEIAFVPFQRNYRFVCRVCGQGQEQARPQPARPPPAAAKPS